MDISKKIQTQIKDIQPKPKWTFILGDILLGFLFIVSLIAGGLFFSHIIYYFVQNSIFPAFFYKPIMFIRFPHIWFLAFTSFILLSIYIFKYTKQGYRYNWKKIILINILLTILLGISLYHNNIAHRNCQRFINTPVYNLCINRQIWLNPEKGFINGEIIKPKKGFLRLKDASNNIWNINDLNNANFKLGDRIKILGEKEKDNNFKPIRIFRVK